LLVDTEDDDDAFFVVFVVAFEVGLTVVFVAFTFAALGFVGGGAG